MADATRTIAVIDGNSLMHRAFHAIRQPMNAPDGRSTGALFGFFNMFIKMVDTFHPDGVICAFDKGKPRVRMEMLPQYKAQRPPMDPALHEQFPMVKELLRTLDVPVAELEGWEGDDILGTLARRGEAAGYEMLLFTGDRDMYQLSTEHVKIVSTQKGVSEVKIMDPATVEDLYHGITPELVPDFYGLKGDTSDNIPGVPGIGPKKAAALIVQYGSLDFVLGGNLSKILTVGHENTLRIAFVLGFFGFGVKAAIWPLHGWLPSAGVAPTPVTALLHAVAVVNAGVFAILRLTYYSYGTNLLQGTWAQDLVMAFAVITIVYGSAMALRMQHLKRRLAYSTVSNLSYILFGATLMSPGGLAAALCHMVVHSFVKIILFFCAGALLCQTHHKEYIFEYEGLGKRMPITFGVFTFASMALKEPVS